MWSCTRKIKLKKLTYYTGKQKIIYFNKNSLNFLHFLERNGVQQDVVFRILLDHPVFPQLKINISKIANFRYNTFYNHGQQNSMAESCLQHNVAFKFFRDYVVFPYLYVEILKNCKILLCNCNFCYTFKFEK